MSDPQILGCWCGQQQWCLCFRTPRFGLLRCPTCGCYRIDPPPLANQQTAADFYTEYYSQVRPVWTPGDAESWFWKVAEKVPELLVPSAAALDLGCGDGHLCAELGAAGWAKVVGIEISATRVARARQLYPHIAFYSSLLEQTAILPGEAGLVAMDSVIEHLPDPIQMLCEVRAYLSKNGRLVVLTPNLESGHFRFLGNRWTGMLAPHAHVFLFTPPALARLLARCGYRIEATGSLHAPVYRPSEYLRRACSGDFKGVLWRAHQEIGGFYGRCINSGPMLYAVATPNPE